MADWHFDWLDVPDFIRAADQILEYPMVDQDPLPRWSFGRLTLLGDAAHPMYPRGANGGAQAILDARALSDALKANPDPVEALKAYEAKRLPATSAGGAGQSQCAARCDPARGLPAHRRQAVQEYR